MNDNKRAGWHPIKGVLLVFLFLGALGVSFFFWRYDDVFPAASVDLKLSKQDVAARARALCQGLGYDTKGSIDSTTFQERSDTGMFLEHEYSMREANALMHSDICVYFWYTRFCKTHSEEEMQVWLNTDGKLAGLNHDIPKENAMPTISRDEAMRLALQFVHDKAGFTLYDKLEPGQAPKLPEGVRLISQGSRKQVHRTDHNFTWEDERHDYKGGHIRTVVEVSGNQVTGYDRELHVPEDYERRYANMRSYNDLLKSISSILFAVVGAGMFFAFVWALSSKKVRWKLALAAGFIELSVSFLDFWNNWPAILQQYQTSDSLQGYLTNKLMSSSLDSVRDALLAIVLVGGIEAVYRARFPHKIAAENILNWKVFSNRTLLESIIAGILVFGIHLGYVAVYYLLGQKMGMWSPLEIRDVSTMSSISPAFSSFTVGVNASVSEECLYRVLCFVLAQRLFKNFWVANFVQAVGWAFMHSDYPQEPAYARGLELTIVGLFYGYLFKRFGVLTGIMSHFIYDAFLGITPMLFSHSASMIVTGLLACSPPFVALGLGVFRRQVMHEDLPDETLLNEHVHQSLPSVPVEPPPEERHLDYKPLSLKLKQVMLALCVVSLLPCVFLHARQLGGWGKITKTQPEIEGIAEKFMHERGVTETGWKVASLLNVNGDENEAQFGYEKLGYKKTEQLLRQARIPMLWWVRFYKPLQKREYDVAVTSEGRPVAFRVIDEENANGKTLGQDDAHKLTEDFLKKYRPEFSPLQFDEAEEQKRKNRADYTVSYVVPSMSMGDARLKVDVDTVGGFVSFPHVVWDIPDAWYFERSKVTIKDHVARAVSAIVLAILSAFGLIWGVGVFRAQTIHWRPVLIATAILSLTTMASQANEFVMNLAQYDTNVPYTSFLIEFVVHTLITGIFYAAMYGVFFAVAHGAFRLLCPGVTGLSLWHSTIHPPQERRQEARILWWDGILSAYTWILATGALASVNSYLEGRFSPEVLLLPLSPLVALTHYSFPAAEQIMNASIMGLAMVCLAPVVVGTYLKYLRTPARYALFTVVVISLINSTTKYWQDYVREVGIGCLDLALLYVWIRYCARNNPVAYFLVGVMNALIATVYYMYKYSTIHTSDLVLITAFLMMPFFVPFAFRNAADTVTAED